MPQIKNLIKSKKFLYIVIGLFAFQAIFFAAAINYKVPSDEEYHYTFINYYAQRPLSAGPIIENQNELFNLGDIQRTPSYLYHYVMSFYLRIIQLFTTSIEAQVFMLRLLNISFGVVALLLLVRLLRKIGISDITTNLTIAWLSITGMFIWVFAGISYDNLAIVLFFLFLTQLADLSKQLNVVKLVSNILTGLILILVKETYLPIVLIGYILLIVYIILKKKITYSLQETSKSIQEVWQGKRRLLFVVLCLFMVLTSGLFIERYAVNYARYKKFTPTCDQVHTVSECMQQGIYRRNTGQKKEFEQRKKVELVRLDNLPTFSVKWVNYIYQRTYFYRGMQSIPATTQGSQLALLSFIFSSVLLIVGVTYIKELNIAQLGIGIITIMYCLIVLLYNFNTYRFYGYPFAVQGRYLLPVLPFIYVGVIGSARIAYSKLQGQLRLLFVVMLLLLLGNNIVVHNPMLIYFNGKTILDQPVIGFMRSLIS